EDLPRSMEEYFDYQAIILSNVAAHDLSEEKMKLFEALVKAVGIGFVMLGGENSFGAGGYQGTPVERLLPVDMEIKQRKVLPNGALAMVVHSCELGNGNWWAIQVIQQSLRILSPRDYAGVLYYGMSDQWLFPMTRITERQMMLSRLQGFNPGDMMSFEGIMIMALAGLTTTEASIKHIIVLSDGDPVMPSAATIQKITAARITISTICYGAHGGIPPGMQLLAQQGGGKFYYLQNPSNLPEIFIREATTVQKSLISEERFTPGLHVRGPMLQGIEETEIPPLDGYVITSPKDLATLHLLHPPSAEDPMQDPVLASWTYGLGRTVAFTSDAGRRWGRAWAAWSGYQQFWSQCVRWVSRPKNDDRFRLTRSIEGENALVSIDAITPDGRFLNGLDFAGTVTGPDLEPQPLSVRQVGPGLYRAEFPARKRGTYTVTLSHERDGRPASHVTGLTVPYSPEYRPLETNRDLLRQAAAAGAGKYHEDAAQADFFARDFPVTREVTDIWHSLLLTAIALLFADVFARRVAVDFRKLAVSAFARVTALIRRRRVEALPADARLRTLLERKAKLREAASARYQPSGGTPAPPRGRSDSTDASAFLAGDSPDAPLESGPSPPARPPAAASPAEKGAEASKSYTARLLEAKKRALHKDDQGTKGS
ncbi:MAG TPA: glutamine amidotransferase, partial [Planctomycetota bacterium]|nr:glutamine amidotransferase [Planctomycetota bacterium]